MGKLLPFFCFTINVNPLLCRIYKLKLFTGILYMWRIEHTDSLLPSSGGTLGVMKHPSVEELLYQIHNSVLIFLTNHVH